MMVNSKIICEKLISIKMKVFSQNRKIIPAKLFWALNNTNYIEINRYNLTYIRMKIHWFGWALVHNLTRAGRSCIVEINAWSWSFVNLQIILILIRYPLKCRNQLPIRSQEVFRSTNERTEKLWISKIKKIQKCPQWMDIKIKQSGLWVSNAKVSMSFEPKFI